MANYVCTQIVGNVCQQWAEYNPPSVLPEITSEQGAEIATAILSVLAVAWVFQQLARFLKGL
jgi:hypothetical protein